MASRRGFVKFATAPEVSARRACELAGDECANLETFYNRDHARALSRLYMRDYNERRPHSSLGYLTPNEFRKQQEKKNARTAAPATK